MLTYDIRFRFILIFFYIYEIMYKRNHSSKHNFFNQRIHFNQFLSTLIFRPVLMVVKWIAGYGSSGVGGFIIDILFSLSGRLVLLIFRLYHFSLFNHPLAAIDYLSPFYFCSFCWIQMYIIPERNNIKSLNIYKQDFQLHIER